MNRKQVKKSSLNPTGSQENIPFSLPSINNIEKKFPSKEGLIAPNPNYNFINVDYQKKLSNLFSGTLTEQEKGLIEEMFQKIEEQRKEIEQRNSTLLAIQRNFESLSLLCKNEKNMNQELQRKVAFYMEENGVLIDKVKTLQEKNKILMEEITAKDKEIVSLRDRSEKMSVFSDKIKRLEEELDKRNKIINQNQRDMNELALENKNLKESLRETERNAGKVVGTLEEMRKEINMKTLEINEKRNMIEVLQDDFKDLGREKEFLDVKCASLEEKIEGLTNELKTKNSDIFQLKEKNRRLEEKESIFIQSKLNGEEVFRQENERLRKFMKEKDDEIRKLEEKNSFLTNDKTKLESIIDELKKVREKNNDDLSILNEKLKESEVLNKGVENKIREMEGKIQSLEIEKRNSGLDIDNLKKKIRETEEINYKHQREINDRNLNEVRKTEELEKLRGKCEYFQKKTIESNEKLTKSDELLAEKMKEITNLKEEAVFLNRKLMDLTIEKEDILKNMENLDKNREGFIEEYKKSIQKNQMLQKEIDLISGERDSFLSQLKDKQSLMSENQNLSRSLEMFKQQEAFMKEKDQIIKEKDYNLKEKEANIQKSEIVIKQLKNENKSFEDKIFELEALIKKLNPEKLEQMKKSIETRESSLKNVIAKLENAEESLIANLSCTYCLELLNKPIICFPCGHSFCEKCKQAYEGVCFECKRGKEPKIFRNRLFEEILTKIQYIRTTTEALSGPLNGFNSLKI